MRPLQLLNLLARNAKRGEIRAEGNVIYIYDVIVGSAWEAEYWGGVSPEGFLKLLAGMTGPVTLRINSPGGEVFAGRAIAQAMREYDGEITVHVDGVAASIASVIAASGARCVMAPGSFLMIHKAWTIGFGNADELTKTAGLLDKIDGTIAETYAAKSGKTSAAEFVDLMADETWFTAAEAVEIGLADEAVAEGAANANAMAQARAWDFSAYAKPPAAITEAAPAPAAEVEAEPEAEPANPVRDEPAAPPEPTAPAVEDTERRSRIHAVRMLAEDA